MEPLGPDNLASESQAMAKLEGPKLLWQIRRNRE